MRFGAALRARTGSDTQTLRMEGGPRGGLPESSSDGSGRASAVREEERRQLCAEGRKGLASSGESGARAVVQTAQRMQSSWSGVMLLLPGRRAGAEIAAEGRREVALEG